MIHLVQNCKFSFSGEFGNDLLEKKLTILIKNIIFVLM